MWANKRSGARLFGLEEATFFCTFELFSQGLPLPPTQETNRETGLFSVAPGVAEGYPGEKQKDKVTYEEGAGDGQGSLEAGRCWERQRWAERGVDQRRRDGKTRNEERKEMAGGANITTFQTRIKAHRGLEEPATSSQ